MTQVVEFLNGLIEPLTYREFITNKYTHLDIIKTKTDNKIDAEVTKFDNEIDAEVTKFENEQAQKKAEHEKIYPIKKVKENLKKVKEYELKNFNIQIIIFE